MENSSEESVRHPSLSTPTLDHWRGALARALVGFATVGSGLTRVATWSTAAMILKAVLYLPVPAYGSPPVAPVMVVG